MGRAPAGKRFVTKLLPGCYTSVTLRVHNGCLKTRCSSPFPFITLGASGFRLYMRARRPEAHNRRRPTPCRSRQRLCQLLLAQLSTSHSLCSQVIEQGYHMAVRNARLHAELAAKGGPKALSVATSYLCPNGRGLAGVALRPRLALCPALAAPPASAHSPKRSATP